MKCSSCGKFVSYRSIEEGSTSQIYTPDSEYSVEELETICKECRDKDEEFMRRKR